MYWRSCSRLELSLTTFSVFVLNVVNQAMPGMEIAAAVATQRAAALSKPLRFGPRALQQCPKPF